MTLDERIMGVLKVIDAYFVLSSLHAFFTLYIRSVTLIPLFIADDTEAD